jgi:hypothetical protein
MGFGDAMKKENMNIDCVVGEFPHFQVPTSIRLGVGKTWNVCKNCSCSSHPPRTIAQGSSAG